jgi:hypothetical protein
VGLVLTWLLDAFGDRALGMETGNEAGNETGNEAGNETGMDPPAALSPSLAVGATSPPAAAFDSLTRSLLGGESPVDVHDATRTGDLDGCKDGLPSGVSGAAVADLGSLGRGSLGLVAPSAGSLMRSTSDPLGLTNGTAAGNPDDVGAVPPESPLEWEDDHGDDGEDSLDDPLRIPQHFPPAERPLLSHPTVGVDASTPVGALAFKVGT